MIPSAVAAQGDSEPEPGFHWGPALRQATIFLFIEQGGRLLQKGTREGLKGPFWGDYFRSVKNLGGWNDGDTVMANFVGHPMQGAVSGYIQVQNDDFGKYQEFGLEPDYWRSRMRAMFFSAAYSLNFELGPISEASIGNVGKKPGTMGAIDLVFTPVGGLGWQITEDAMDRFFIRWVERKTDNLGILIITRSMLNPSRAFANILRFRVPWHRDTRPGITFRR